MKFRLQVDGKTISDIQTDPKKWDIARHEGVFVPRESFKEWEEIFRKAWSCHNLSKKPSARMKQRKDEAILTLVEHDLSVVDEKGLSWPIRVYQIEGWGL